MQIKYKAITYGVSLFLILLFMYSGTVQQGWFEHIRGNTVTSGNIKIKLSENWYPTYNSSKNISSIIYRLTNDNYPKYTSIQIEKLSCSKEEECVVYIDFLPNKMVKKIEGNVSDSSYIDSSIGKIVMVKEWTNDRGDALQMYYAKVGVALTVKEESSLSAIKSIYN